MTTYDIIINRLRESVPILGVETTPTAVQCTQIHASRITCLHDIAVLQTGVIRYPIALQYSISPLGEQTYREKYTEITTHTLTKQDESRIRTE